MITCSVRRIQHLTYQRARSLPESFKEARMSCFHYESATAVYSQQFWSQTRAKCIRHHNPSGTGTADKTLIFHRMNVLKSILHAYSSTIQHCKAHNLAVYRRLVLYPFLSVNKEVIRHESAWIVEIGYISITPRIPAETSSWILSESGTGKENEGPQNVKLATFRWILGSWKQLTHCNGRFILITTVTLITNTWWFTIKYRRMVDIDLPQLPCAVPDHLLQHLALLGRLPMQGTCNQAIGVLPQWAPTRWCLSIIGWFMKRSRDSDDTPLVSTTSNS